MRKEEYLEYEFNRDYWEAILSSQVKKADIKGLAEILTLGAYNEIAPFERCDECEAYIASSYYREKSEMPCKLKNSENKDICFYCNSSLPLLHGYITTTLAREYFLENKHTETVINIISQLCVKKIDEQIEKITKKIERDRQCT